MSNDNLDPLIKREFEALGLNIVSNDLLADMVFERVKKRRIRKWLIAGGVALSILALAGLSYVVGTSALFSSGKPVIQSNSYAIPGDENGGLALPQYANLRLNGTTLEERTYTFTFALEMGQVVEVFTDPRDGAGGNIAELTVYKRDTNGQREKIQTYPVAAGLSSSEFGNINSAGLYDFEYVFTDLSYRGVVRVGILLGQFTEL
jgi:hypothetical protein